MKLFDLYAEMALNDKKFRTSLNNAEKDVKNFAKSSEFNLGKIGSAFMKIGAVAATAFGVLAGIGMKYNADMEMYTTNFGVMLGDQEAGIKKVEALKKMAAKTPFELSNLADATQTLLAFNVNADDTENVLGMLGDISLGNAQKLETLTRAYGKMSSSQKVTLEDINMMIDSGYNPLLQVQEDMGISMEEVYDKISKGEIAFSQIEEAMKAATSEGGQFYKGMDLASQTTNGLVSTLKDVVGSKLGEFFTSASDKLKEMLPNIISFIENLDVDEIIENLKVFLNVLGLIAAIFTPLIALIAGYNGYLLIMDTYQKLVTASQWLWNVALGANPINLVILLIASLIAALIYLWTTSEEFRNAVIAIGNAVATFFGNIINSIINYFTNLINSIKEFGNNIKTWFDDTIADFKEFGKNLVEGLWNGIKSMGDWLWGHIEDFFGGIGDFVGDLFDINSPSRLFKYYGEMIDKGFIDGLEGGENKVQSTLKNIMELPNASLAKSGNNITFNINGAQDPNAVAMAVNRLLGGVV